VATPLRFRPKGSLAGVGWDVLPVLRSFSSASPHAPNNLFEIACTSPLARRRIPAAMLSRHRVTEFVTVVEGR
jgi:hypothetical protein